MLMLNLIVKKKEKRLKLVNVDWKVCFVVSTCCVYLDMLVVKVYKRFVGSIKIKEKVIINCYCTVEWIIINIRLLLNLKQIVLEIKFNTFVGIVTK